MQRLLRRARRPSRPALLLVILVVLLFGHGLALYHASAHVVVSTAVASAVGILVLVKHAGLLGALWRRRRSAPDW
jgi:disulfide bond formation protein DsbB